MLEKREESKNFYWPNQTKMLTRSLPTQEQAPIAQTNSSNGPDFSQKIASEHLSR